MKDYKDDYLENIIKPLEQEVKKLREKKRKKWIFWTKREEEDLEYKENLLIEKFEKLGSYLE